MTGSLAIYTAAAAVDAGTEIDLSDVVEPMTSLEVVLRYDSAGGTISDVTNDATLSSSTSITLATTALAAGDILIIQYSKIGEA